VTRHAWSAFTENRRQAVPVSGDTRLGGLLETVEAREDLVRRLEEQFDHELLELALARTRQRVEPHTWEAFQLTALEQHPAGEVAGRLGMNVATVYVARSKVQKLVRQELRLLEGEFAVGSPDPGHSGRASP
jgi:RNA polymerase sigma-70 factor (ECF subfamily)